MTQREALRVTVDLTNPGQFFACCGLLELANRVWGGAEGWFADREFRICLAGSPWNPSLSDFFDALRRCRLTNTMTDSQLRRLEEISSMGGKQRRQIRGIEEEKKALEKLRREEPIVLHDPFNMRIDWFSDEHAGGSRFKTWAGQQSVFDIATAMKEAVDDASPTVFTDNSWLTLATDCDDLPFNFDSDLGGQASAIDVGFSLDPLGIKRRTRPLIELLAFVGLQRFRPLEHAKENRFTYVPWVLPLPPSVAAGACSAAVSLPQTTAYDFRLLYRTKYLKSFLSAQPSGGTQ